MSNLKYNLYSKKQYLQNKPVCDEIKKYKGIHKGERCFIIGTGPSLTAEDLEKLKGEITFASNRIYEIFNQTDWRPTYYMNQDVQLIQKTVDKIKEVEVKHKFMPLEVMDEFKNETDISYFVLRYKEFYPGLAEFSKNVSKFLGQGFTVTYGAMQMAYYMGFKEVYLLGIDHNYSVSLDEKGMPVRQDDVKDYFKGSKASNEGINLPRIVESTAAYITARQFADKSNSFAIYNATRGGKLEAFERVDLDEVLAGERRQK